MTDPPSESIPTDMALKRSFIGVKVAILHQSAPIPAVRGLVKSMKPGGYSDSGADIAYSLRRAGIDVVTPVPQPSLSRDVDWSFGDDTQSILSSVWEHGATVLWANTVLHSRHALADLASAIPHVKVVGQNTFDTERVDDKEWTNAWLAQQDGLRGAFPRSKLLWAGQGVEVLEEMGLPLVVKPIRGRGSHGVTLVKKQEELEAAVKGLLAESEGLLVEEFMAGEEITITVMPPGEYEITGVKQGHWSMPVVTRYNHINGVAPYNGIVAVTANSRTLSPAEHVSDPAYAQAQRQCELAARYFGASAPMRIDCRRRIEGGEFVLFDVNMKPNATGPGRPGREDQASLTTMAAEGLGWDYGVMIRNMLRQATPIAQIVERKEWSI